MLQSACFTLEILGDRTFCGYTNGQTWNGWACPFFSHEEALNIVEGMKDWQIAYYDEKRDIFFFGDEEDSLESFEAVELDGISRLYPIGAHSWIWEQSPALKTERR